jgi:hypothetical protein
MIMSKYFIFPLQIVIRMKEIERDERMRLSGKEERKDQEFITKNEMKVLTNLYQNVTTNYHRTASNRCSDCSKIRATVGCSISSCPSQFHFPCARGKAKLFYCGMAYVLVGFNFFFD